METVSYGIDLPGSGPACGLFLALLFFALGTVLRYGGPLSASARPAGLRVLFFLLLGLGILAPYREYRRLLPPRLIVLLDDSQSMDRPIAAAKLPRFASSAVPSETTPRKAAEAVLDRLPWPQDRYRVEKVLLSGESRSTDCSPLGDRLVEILDASTTSPAAGPTDRPAAIVLFSDGLVNEGRSLADAARQGAAQGVPVVAVACGDERPPPDLRWSRSSLPRRAFLGEALEIPAILRGLALPEPQEATVRFEQVQGETLRLQQTRQAQLGPGDAETRVPLLLVPRREGVFRYRLTVESPPELREWDRTNNTVEFELVVDRQRLRVLLIEQSPRFEYRFLRELLRREPEIELRTVLFDADPRAVEQDPVALDTAELTPELIDGFPVVILGDVDPERLGPAAISALVRTAENRALVFLAGQTFLPRRYLDSPLASAWPRGRFRIEPPDRPLALIPADDPLLPRRETREAEPVTVYGAVLLESSDPALRVLAGTETGETLLALRRHAGGGVYWQGTDQTWRWREIDNGDFYRRYWLGILRNLAATTQTPPPTDKDGKTDRKASDSTDESRDDVASVLEREHLAQDGEALRQLARHSGGTFLTLNELNDPAAWLDTLPRGEPVLDQLRRETLISPYLLLMLLLLPLPFLWSVKTSKKAPAATDERTAAPQKA